MGTSQCPTVSVFAEDLSLHFSSWLNVFSVIAGQNKQALKQLLLLEASECENRRFSESATCMSHLLDSECVSASLTVTALTVNYTVTANCLLH